MLKIRFYLNRCTRSKFILLEYRIEHEKYDRRFGLNSYNHEMKTQRSTIF